MDEKLRPVLTSAIGLLLLFVAIGAFVRSDVPVPGTVYLLVPVATILSVYVSFEGMARYVSGVVKAEGERFSRRREPIPGPLVDGGFEWLFIAVDGYQFIKYVINQPNVLDGVGTILVVPPYLVESENEGAIVVRGRPLRLSPYAIHMLMQRRKWRKRFESYDGFDPEVTCVKIVLWSTTIHPDALHYAESVGNLGALAAELSENESVFERVDARLQKSLTDQIMLFHTMMQAPTESRAVRREPPEEATAR